MTRQELLIELNTVLDDLVGAASTDFIGSNNLKIAYLAEGQEKFCEETGFIVDGSSTVTTVTLESGIKDYTLSDRIIKVLDVYDGSRKLGSIHDDPSYEIDFRSTSSGDPHLWRTDFEPGKIRVHPTPTRSMTLQMQVWRYPLESIRKANPEIPERFQHACVEWAVHKLLHIQDAEIRNKAKSNEHYQNFMLYVNDGIKHLRRLRGVEAKVAVNNLYTLGMC